MSAMYVPSKRKASRPQLKLQTPEVITIMKREVAGGGKVPSTNEEASSQKMKRTYGRKKYHDLQPVSMGPAEDSVGGTCTPVVQANFMNGSERQLVATGHATVGAMEERIGPSVEVIRETDFDMKKKRKMEEVGQASLKKYIEEVKQTVPVIVPVAQYTQKSSVASVVTQSSFSNMKKEVPCYPPGSQEERWQLQILSKGRVNCPKCRSVGRKTVEGLKKHMAACTLHPFTCQQCGKQLKTSTGMKYHLMADHNKLPIPDGNGLDDQEAKEKLRKVLKRMGKLKCSKEGCTGSFTSIMGYVYHMKKCGKEESELAKLLMNCKHCGKAYRSRAGLEYHLKSEHGPVPQETTDWEGKAPRETSTEHVASGRVKRMSAQVAVFHLREIASQELLKEWPKRKVQRDLVPDDRKLRYSRPGLPAFSQEVLRKWKNEVKLQRKVQCPNKGCGCYYTSVSGLKAHLGLCTLGDFEAGKYKCLICKKEFNSESGVKYHINSVHSQDWFVVTSKAKTFTSNKQLKPEFKDPNTELSGPATPNPALRFPQRPCTWQDSQPPECEAILRVTADPESPQPKRKKGPRDRKGNGQGKDCYEFSDSHSSTCGTGSSSSESETEEAEAPRHDAWALNRPLTQPERARDIL